MPVPYDWSKTPKTYIDRNDKIGLLIGSILAGGMGAASGQGGGDSALRGVAGAAAGFGGGANQLEDSYSRMISDAMKRQQQEYDQSMQDKEFSINKPYKESVTNFYNQRQIPGRPSRYDSEEARLNLAKKKNEIALQRKILSGEPIKNQKESEFETFLKYPAEIKEQFKEFKGLGRAAQKVRPIQESALKGMNAAISSLSHLDTLEKNKEESRGIPYISEATGFARSKMGDQGVQDFNSAKNLLIVNAQDVMKGTPSNFDIENFKKIIATLSDTPQEKQTKITTAKKQIVDTLKIALQNYDKQGYEVPEYIREAFEKYSVPTVSAGQPQTADDFMKLLEGE